MNLNRLLLLFVCCSYAVLLTAATPLWAQGTYLSKEDFLSQNLGTSYTGHKLWFSKPIKQKLKKIFGHKYPGLRIRYWTNDENKEQTAWILNEIGKVKPITFGVVVNNQQIESIYVLAFRESRGWEIKQTFFTDQFLGASLTDRLRLTQHIDSISGATLSVIAMKKVARAALYLSGQVTVTAPAIGHKPNGGSSG
ncbi:MAG: FMN-binding protein [Candidatus Thiodiazotropha taylori]|nr:FMN-binding protein [Candidatus Thiodiazotropha taylori]MCG8085105.1 FMN-binding protein [Candidatus Thiodiazotropha taylori]